MSHRSRKAAWNDRQIAIDAGNSCADRAAGIRRLVRIELGGGLSPAAACSPPQCQRTWQL